MSSILHDPPHWRERAKEARALAEKATDKAVRESIMKVAADYEKQAA
jgi:hypothetical protein